MAVLCRNNLLLQIMKRSRKICQNVPERPPANARARLAKFFPVPLGPYWADRFGRSFHPMLEDYVCYNALNISQFRRYRPRWRHKIRKFAVEVCQNVKISRRDCAKILRMVTIEIL